MRHSITILLSKKKENSNLIYIDYTCNNDWALAAIVDKRDMPLKGNDNIF